ncbi:MAG: hypothetical protein JWM35_2520 [Verrucomicrobia bacterium]|nr:hypothetical protein [Verrucomicrobiota bacterium]
MDKPWKVVLAFLGVFVAGILSGAMLGVRFGRHLMPPANHASAGQNFGPQIMKRLEDQLELTPDQAKQIQPIVERAQVEVQRLRKENVREVTKAMDQMHTEVSALLTPEQRVKLEELRKKFRERSERLRREFRNGERSETPSP